MDRILILDKKLIFLGLALILVLSFSFIPNLEVLIPPVVVSNDAIGETADVIISKSRKGSIRAEFPGEFYDKTIDEIENIAKNSKDGEQVRKARKALKLLKDGRFKK